MMTPRVALFQTVIPDYRSAPLNELIRSLGSGIVIYAGLESYDPTIRTNATLDTPIEAISNRFFCGRRLLWQRGALAAGLRPTAVILEMNPRNLSVWAIALGRRLLRRPTVLWGHAWPRQGPRSQSDVVRNVLRRLGDVIVVYTETQAIELRARMPGKRILAAPNAIFSARQMSAVAGPARDVVYVGRLVAAKKPALLLQAWQRLGAATTGRRLVFVGDGPLRPLLEEQVRQAALTNVVFCGHVSDFDALREIYSHALVSVSPGYVGLSITQSFAFGVPMIISRRESHSPEIEAAEIGTNSEWFETDDSMSLSGVLGSFFAREDYWLNRRASISAKCALCYSAEAMAAHLLDAALGPCVPDSVTTGRT